MIEDLNDLSLLGKDNTRLLEAINFDLSLLDKAAQTSREMAVLLDEKDRERERERGEPSEAKKIRDQAYTHLKEAVDDILEAGKFVFRQNKKRLRKYASAYRRNTTSKKKRSRKKRQQRMKIKVPGKLFPAKHFCHRDHIAAYGRSQRRVEG
jgi:hypothetical protein